MVNKIGDTSIDQLQQRLPTDDLHEEQIRAKRVKAFDDNDKVVNAQPFLSTRGAQEAGSDLSNIPQDLHTNLTSFLQSLPAADRARFIQAGHEFNAKLLEAAQGGLTTDNAGQGSKLSSAITSGVSSAQSVTLSTESSSLVSQTMMMSYAAAEQKEMDLAQKAAGTTGAKKTTREEMSKLQDEITDWPDDGSKREITYMEPKKDADGNYVVDAKGNYVFEEKTVLMSKDEAKNLLDKMDKSLSNFSDMNQMDMFDLQEASQKKSQIMQLLSDVAKTIHDTAKSIINNMR
jgi:hypothetical protein